MVCTSGPFLWNKLSVDVLSQFLAAYQKTKKQFDSDFPTLETWVYFVVICRYLAQMAWPSISLQRVGSVKNGDRVDAHVQGTLVHIVLTTPGPEKTAFG
jgi:hypothetical protein